MAWDKGEFKLIQRSIVLSMATFCAMVLVLFGCGGEVDSKVLSDPNTLPLYGDSPLVNTMYVGSNTEYHYFVASNGKIVGKYQIKIENAQIVPNSCDLNSGQNFIVSKVEGNRILLWGHMASPQSHRVQDRIANED